MASERGPMPDSATLKKIQPGGVILFAPNIVEPSQTWELLRDCQSAVSTPTL